MPRREDAAGLSASESGLEETSTGNGAETTREVRLHWRIPMPRDPVTPLVVPNGEPSFR
jgi:hypothetical protein